MKVRPARILALVASLIASLATEAQPMRGGFRPSGGAGAAGPGRSTTGRGGMTKRLAVVLAGAIFGLTSSSLAFDTKWHADATRIAMDHNGFSSDTRLLCQFTNYLTDFFSAVDLEDVYKQLPSGMPKGGSSGLQGIDIGNVARMHFDALTSHAQVEHQWKTLEANTKAALVKWAAAPSVNSGYRPVVLMTIVGASLHAVQDFYSHSNWLRKVAPSTGVAPIWFEVPETERVRLDIKTGWYPDGNKRGVLNHHDENKDYTGRPLNAQAFEVATRASTDWVRRIMAGTSEVPWETLKAWKAQPANLNGMWLRNADATFITTTSTLAGHWDGKTPAKNVFAPDAGRNKVMAGEALEMTMGVYSQNIASSSGATPTPHWVGFTVFHVEKDLAKGLYLQDVAKK